MRSFVSPGNYKMTNDLGLRKGYWRLTASWPGRLKLPSCCRGKRGRRRKNEGVVKGEGGGAEKKRGEEERDNGSGRMGRRKRVKGKEGKG